MPAPIISSTTSYLGFKRNEPFNFQPSAPGALSFAIDTPPPGVTIDSPTSYAATGVASTDVVTGTGSSYANGDKVYFSAITGGSGLAANTIYYVRDVSSATFKLAATLGGPVIDFTTDISAGTIRKVSTGLISAATGVAVQGPYVFTVSAINGDGTGSKEFCIHISQGSAVAPGASDTAIDLVIDMVTRAVRLGLPGSGGGVAGGEEAAALAYVKEDDTVMFVVRAEKNGTQIDPDFDVVKMVCKQLEAETVLVTSAAFEKVGAGATAAWNLPVTFSGTALAGVLADREGAPPKGDLATTLAALTEIEWECEVTHNAAPLVLRGTSRTFTTQIDRDLAGN